MPKYIGVSYTSARETVEAIALDSEPYRKSPFVGFAKKEADETLFLELDLRGYDLSKLRDEDEAVEIVRVG